MIVMVAAPVGKAVIRIPETTPGAGSVLALVLLKVLAATLTCTLPPWVLNSKMLRSPAVGICSIPKFRYRPDKDPAVTTGEFTSGDVDSHPVGKDVAGCALPNSCIHC